MVSQAAQVHHADGPRRNITPALHLPGNRPATVTYRGSVTECHGTARLIDECDCLDCLRQDPWDRLAKLRVLLAAGSNDDGTWHDLTHVHWSSITSHGHE